FLKQLFRVARRFPVFSRIGSTRRSEFPFAAICRDDPSQTVSPLPAAMAATDDILPLAHRGEAGDEFRNLCLDAIEFSEQDGPNGIERGNGDLNSFLEVLPRPMVVQIYALNVDLVLFGIQVAPLDLL